MKTRVRTQTFVIAACLILGAMGGLRGWGAETEPASRPGTAPAETRPALRVVDGSVVLKAEDSAGGHVLSFGDGSKAVLLDKTCAPDGNWQAKARAHIEWKFAEKAPKGWWRVTLEGNPQYRPWPNRAFAVQLMGGNGPGVMVDANYGADKGQKLECWIYTSSEVEGVLLQPSNDQWYWLGMWAIRQVKLEHTAPGTLGAKDAVTLDLPVAADGSVATPPELPEGNWILKATTTKEGAALFEGKDKRVVSVPYPGRDVYKRPSSFAGYFCMGVPLEKVTIKSETPIRQLELRHNVLRATKSIATDDRLITAVDAAKAESGVLEMAGAGLTGDGPEFPLMPHGKKIAVTTSWDDGKETDLRCAEILNKHGYRASFFLNKDSPAMAMLEKLEALNVEVGSHCFHHPSLYMIPPDAAAEECAEMRKALEKSLKHPVISMGYPNGYWPAYDVEGDYVLRAVRNAGYWSARTTISRQETVESIIEPLAMRSDGFFGNSKDLERVWATSRTKEGAIFYFWGHSWQIGKTDEQWKTFETFVMQFAHQPDAWYPSLGELSLWMWARKNAKMEVTEKGPEKVTVKVSRPWLHPYLAARCPMTLKVPAGVKRVRWQGKEVPVENGLVELVWGEK